MSDEMYTDSATSDPAASLAVLMAESGKTTLYDLARVTIAAGYSKPRTIETVEELDALPDGAIILEPHGTPTRAVKRQDGKNWWIDGPDAMSASALIPLPATVLYEPAP